MARDFLEIVIYALQMRQTYGTFRHALQFLVAWRRSDLIFGDLLCRAQNRFRDFIGKHLWRYHGLLRFYYEDSRC